LIHFKNKSDFGFVKTELLHFLLKPADGQPIVGPSKDMVLGVYYLTVMQEGLKGEGKAFSSMEEVERAYDLDYVDRNQVSNLED